MIRKGLAVAVILLFIGVAFAPSINANVSKPDLETDSNTEIETITEDNEDCGCENDNSEFEWGFPVICTLLFPFMYIAVYIWLSSFRMFDLPLLIMAQIGSNLNCFWALD